MPDDPIDEQIDFINECLKLSIENDILLEVVYTAFIDNKYNGDISKAFEQSLWYWMVFESKKPKKINVEELKEAIERIKNGDFK